MNAISASSLAACRAALRKGPLHRESRGWRFGRRLFRFRTINALVDAGEAIRVGDHIVAWRPHADDRAKRAEGDLFQCQETT